MQLKVLHAVQMANLRLSADKHTVSAGDAVQACASCQQEHLKCGGSLSASATRSSGHLAGLDGPHHDLCIGCGHGQHQGTNAEIRHADSQCDRLQARLSKDQCTAANDRYARTLVCTHLGFPVTVVTMVALLRPPHDGKVQASWQHLIQWN